jgi:hypothetical protein
MPFPADRRMNPISTNQDIAVRNHFARFGRENAGHTVLFLFKTCQCVPCLDPFVAEPASYCIRETLFLFTPVNRKLRDAVA